MRARSTHTAVRGVGLLLVAGLFSVTHTRGPRLPPPTRLGSHLVAMTRCLAPAPHDAVDGLATCDSGTHTRFDVSLR
jgi:hypothetical protein